jgi:hypothetical protein
MTRFRRTITGLLVSLGLAAMAAGCGKSSSPSAPRATTTPPTAQASRDIAQHFATTLSRGGVPIDRIGRATLADLATPAARGLQRATLQDEIEFSWSLVVTFFDAENREQPTYIEGATEHAAVRAKARGRVSTAEYQATLAIDRALDVHGLLPATTEIEVDGTARDDATAAYEEADGSASRSYDLHGAGTLEDVRQSKDSEAHPYPLSGIARWNVVADASERDAKGTREAHYEARVKVTFNGTRYPTIEVEETWRYRMDLETGALMPLPS